MTLPLMLHNLSKLASLPCSFREKCSQPFAQTRSACAIAQTCGKALSNQVAAADTDALLDVKLAEGPPATELWLDARSIELQVHACMHACIRTWAPAGQYAVALL